MRIILKILAAPFVLLLSLVLGAPDLAAHADYRGIEHPRSDCRRLWAVCLYHRRRSGIGHPGAVRGGAHFTLWTSGPIRVADPKAG